MIDNLRTGGYIGWPQTQRLTDSSLVAPFANAVIDVLVDVAPILERLLRTGATYQVHSVAASCGAGELRADRNSGASEITSSTERRRETHNGSVSFAAQQAGLSQQGLHKLLARHRLAAAEFRR